MKIEKISDNQIKCTLTRSDLASRQLKLSELAYGTEKAKGLFQDMMDQANLEFGFDASDIPLMIEAIPVSMDCIILMITKVENPDEVDTRFSTLSNLKDIISSENSSDCCPDSGCDDPKDFEFNKFADQAKKLAKESQPSAERVYSFDSLETVIDFAHRIKSYRVSDNTLYKSSDDNRFYLHICRNSDYSEDFSAICCTALEYGKAVPMVLATTAYMNEHFEKFIANEAIQKLVLI